MNILPPGSWEAFNEWSDKGVFIPGDISEKIHLILKGEQLREIGHAIHKQYVGGFNREAGNNGMTRSLALLEMEEEIVHCSDCHPGRFSLNLDAGARAVGGNPALLCGGYVTSRKHIKLDSSEFYDPGMREVEGFQDVYFLGGLPLQYWSFGDQMGMKLLDSASVSHEPGLMWMWRGKEDAARYHLTDGLMVFGEEAYTGLDAWLGTDGAARYLQRQEQNMIDG